MRSISTRLAVWYASAATLTLACLFVVGYQLLQTYLIHGLDLLNSAEFEQIKAHMGSDYMTQSKRVIDERIRETTEFSSVLFYIEIDSPQRGTVFSSRNLQGRTIPDIPGQHHYDTQVPRIGELRVAEFVLPFLDITIATPLSPVRKVMEGYVEVCAWLLAAMLGASVLIGFGLSRLALRPMRLMRETANRIRSDNLSERIPVTQVQDEVSDLARLLNQMFDRLESAFNQVRNFTAEASHELKTPLSLVRLQAEKLLVGGNLSAPNEEAVQMQLEELARVNQIIDEMLFLSRAEARAITLQCKPNDPERFLKSFALDARVLAEHGGQKFQALHEGAGSVLFDEKRIRQVLLNLLANALAVSPPEGVVTVRSRLSATEWRVAVEDEGPGLPPDQHERIFNRFVRVNPRDTDGRGSGLGLAICRSIIMLHHGHIVAEAGAEGRGLNVVFTIPVTSAAATVELGGSHQGNR
ncbi:MAG TPA: ATP-binding protein [Steroidobacteraceae bacterium]|nr:ATP-binding protein [Steroidobacteraceae bacterium]